MKSFETVDAYIAAAPQQYQSELQELRKVILSSASGITEKISYGMPYYGYKGRLAYFAIAKTHIGLYITPPILQEFKEELKKYSTATATIRFPLDQKLPLPLIKKLLSARVKLNALTRPVRSAS